MSVDRPMQESLAKARALVAAARRIAVLTGAGISAESGIPTFRDNGGLWAGVRAEDFATPEGFARNPLLVWNWYADRRGELEATRPNPAHLALATLQRRCRSAGGSLALVTQNIDGLHQAAGSTGVLELHGSMTTARCEACEHRQPMTASHVESIPACPACGRRMRPDVVWFGEALPMDVYHAAVQAAAECDLFLTVGTSAVVYPAAGIIDWAISAGARTIEVNLESTPLTRMVTVALHGKAGEILPMVTEG